MKGDNIFNKEEIMFLNQLIKSLEEAEIRLTQAYENKDYEIFHQLKKFILEVQKRISQTLK